MVSVSLLSIDDYWKSTNTFILRRMNLGSFQYYAPGTSSSSRQMHEYLRNAVLPLVVHDEFSSILPKAVVYRPSSFPFSKDNICPPQMSYAGWLFNETCDLMGHVTHRIWMPPSLNNLAWSVLFRTSAVSNVISLAYSKLSILVFWLFVDFGIVAPFVWLMMAPTFSVRLITSLIPFMVDKNVSTMEIEKCVF